METKTRKNELLIAYKNLWRFMNIKEKIYFCLLIFLVVFRCFSVIAITQVLQCLVDEISGVNGRLFGICLPASWNIIQVIVFTHIVMIVIWCITAIIGNMIKRFAVSVSCKVNQKILKVLTSPRINLDYKMTNGEAVFIANSAGESVIFLIKDVLLKIFLPIGACIVALVYIAKIDIISFIAFLFCFVFILISSLVRLKLESKYQNKIEGSKSKINNIYLNSIENISLITMLNSQQTEFEMLKEHNNEYKYNSFKDSNMRMKYWIFAYIIQYILIGFGIAVCVLRKGADMLNIANIVALVSYSQQLCSPLENVGVELGQLQTRAIQYNRLSLLELKDGDYLNQVESIKNAEKMPASEKINKIQIKNLHIKVGEFDKTYNNIEFDSQKINVVCGDSGSGKSVLIGALLGIKTKYKGEIRINNKYTIDSLYNNKNKISYIAQNAMLFDRSIIENIAYPNKKLTKIMKEYIKIFNLENIANRSNINSSILKSLSGGEQRRISLVRGMSKNADVYIFDEPTNDLDNANVKILVREIQKLKNKSIVIVISHDARIFEIADNIINVDKL